MKIKIIFYCSLSIFLFYSKYITANNKIVLDSTNTIKTASAPKFYLGIICAPSYERMLSDNKSISAAWNRGRYVLNYGAEFAYEINKRFQISLSELAISKGAKANIDITNANMPESAIETAELILRVRYIAFTTLINYKLINKSKFCLKVSGGLINAFLMRQTLENTSISKDYKPDPNVIYAYPPQQRIQTLDYYKNYYLGVCLGMTMQFKMGKKINLLLRPNVSYQLNYSLISNAAKNKFLSFANDVGFIYNIK